MPGAPGVGACAGRPESLALELGHRADIEEDRPRVLDRRFDGLPSGLDARVPGGEPVGGGSGRRDLTAPLATGRRPLVAVAFEQADVGVQVGPHQPEAKRRAVPVEDDGRVGFDPGEREQALSSSRPTGR